jgi:hypothetical protein
MVSIIDSICIADMRFPAIFMILLLRPIKVNLSSSISSISTISSVVKELSTLNIFLLNINGDMKGEITFSLLSFIDI